MVQSVVHPEYTCPSIHVDDRSSIISGGSNATSTFREEDNNSLRSDIHDESVHLNVHKQRQYLSISQHGDEIFSNTTSRCTTPHSPIPSIRINEHEHETTWSVLKTRSRYYVPILQWMPTYSTSNFNRDIIAGLSLSCLIIPQALSYATGLCRLPAIHGLYTVSISTIVYACLGMSPQLSVGPEATVSLIMGSGIAHQNGPLNPEAAAAVASLTALIVGLFTFGLGLFRLGFLDSLMSRALLRGFITGVAIVVMIQQTISLLGLKVVAAGAGITPESTSIDRLLFIVRHIRETHLPTALLSACVLLSLLGARPLKRRFSILRNIPEVLVVVIASIILCHLLELDAMGVDILGQVGTSTVMSPLPMPSIPFLPKDADIRIILVNAAMISIIGFVESIAAAKSFARKHNYFVSANRELVGHGMANILGSIFRTFPAFGSLPRSKLLDAAGPSTQMSGLISGLTTLVVTGLFLPYLSHLPMVTLDCVIFIAVIALLQELPHDLGFMWKVRAWVDMTMLTTTFITTMVFSLEVGTFIAVLFSLIITIRQTSYPRITIMGRVKETMYKFGPIKHSRETAEHLEDILIVRVDEPLYFANTGQLKDRLRRLEHYGDLSVHPSEAPRRNDVLRYVIFDLGGMEFIDASAVQILYETIESYHARGIHVLLVELHPNAMPLLERSGVISLIGYDQVYNQVADAIQAVEYNIMCAAVIVHSPENNIQPKP